MDSKTLYIGNLSFYTSEDQIYELFNQIAPVVKVVMGLNRYQKRPCGFCFVEYESHDEAALAVSILNNTMFDDRQLRVDWDAGMEPGREFGRGQSGDQWRDDFREDFDAARGGQGRALLKQIDDSSGRQIFVGKRDGANREGKGLSKRQRGEDEGESRGGGGRGFYKKTRNQ
jgi:nuclear cap-binding protein subunit 2